MDMPTETRTGEAATEDAGTRRGGGLESADAGASHVAAARLRPAAPDAAPAWRAVAYLADPRPTDGAAALFGQKALAERRIAELPAVLVRLYVDSGRPDDAGVPAPALARLLADARAGRFDVVVVEHVSRFAPGLLDALRVAVALCLAGVEVVEARGGSVTMGADVAGIVGGPL